MGVNRALEAAAADLDETGISALVNDLRTVAPLYKTTVVEAVRRSGRLLVVDEDRSGYF